MTQPILEHIDPVPGNSFFLGHYEGIDVCEYPFWHIHPEYEIVYVKNGRGKRHIASHASYYENGDLMLIGPGIPHSSFGNIDSPDNEVVVVQMPANFVENAIFTLTETKKIRELFERSKFVISWSDPTKEEIGKKLCRLKGFRSFQRFIHLLDILHHLSISDKYELLCGGNLSIEINSNDYNRIEKVYEYIAANFDAPISLKDIAAVTGLTPNAFCRFFKHVTGKTFTTHLNEYRIYKASELLAYQNTSITQVMLDSGFSELTHFSRQFKKITGESPREYRKRIRMWDG